MHLCRPPGHVANAVLPSHVAAVVDLDLEALDLLRELDALGIRQRSSLVVDVTNVEDFTHEVDD